jgi:hypothetical protein
MPIIAIGNRKNRAIIVPRVYPRRHPGFKARVYALTADRTRAAYGGWLMGKPRLNDTAWAGGGQAAIKCSPRQGRASRTKKVGIGLDKQVGNRKIAPADRGPAGAGDQCCPFREGTGGTGLKPG